MSILTLPKTIQNAIQTMVYLTLNDKENCNVSKISKEYKISKTYLAKIVQTLSLNKLIKTSTGRNGGIYLNKKPESIKVIDIADAINGIKKKKNLCVLGIGDCNEKTHCPIHHSWKQVKNTINKKLSEQNLKTLSIELSKKINKK